ncbi:MAG TPA: MFS transporter, partial [Actinomycetes bacterium]|nr:MFS transporter [Actinomycetes bacterium]
MSAPPRASRRSLVFWTATALIAVDTILFTMVVPALPEYQDRYGFSDAVASLIFAAFPVGQLVTAVWAAGVVDRFGRRPVMILAALTLAAATLAFALASGPAFIALARLVQGLAAGLVWTAALAAISDVYPQEELGFRMGLAETAGGVMGLVGPPFAGVLIEAVGLEETFYIATALPVLALIPALLVPETRRAEAAAPSRLLPDLRRLWAVRSARVAAVTLATAAGVLALVEPLLPLDLSERLDLSSLGVGIVFAIGLAAYLLLVPIAGRWSDRRGRRTPIIAGGVLMAVGLPFVAVGPVGLV